MQSKFFKTLIPSSVVLVLLLVFLQATYKHSCAAILGYLVIFYLIGYHIFEQQMFNKECYRDNHFNPDSPINKLFKGKVLALISTFFGSMILTFNLSLNLIDIGYKGLFIAVLYIPFMVLLYNQIASKSKTHSSEKAKQLNAKKFTAWIATGIIAVILFAYYYYIALEPEFMRSTFKETLVAATQIHQSNCHAIDMLLRSRSEVDALLWYGMAELTEGMTNATIRVAIWLIFLLLNLFSILGINMVTVQVINLFDKVLQRQIKTEE